MNLRETQVAKKAAALRERNTKMEERIATRVQESLRRQVESQYGFDPMSDDYAPYFDLNSPGFSIKAFREAVYELSAKMREANAEGNLQQLLRSGIQTAVNSMYQAVATSYQEVVSVLSSSKAIELFAPLYRAGVMQQVDELEEPPQLGVQGMDIQIRSLDFGAMLTVSKNAIDDDQTSQIQMQAQQIGENGKILKDSRVFIRLIGAAGTDFGGGAVLKSQTGAQANETTWPFNTAFTNGAGQNRLTTYQALNYQAFINGRLLARKMKDAKGNRMAVNPDTVFCGVGVADAIHEMVDADSQFWPVQGTIMASNAGASGSDTGAGAQHAKNILKGAYNVVDSIFLPDTSYGIMQAGKGFYLVQREPLSVLMESPSAGVSFSARAFRWNIHERYEVDWIEPRFAVLLNDGSVV